MEKKIKIQFLIIGVVLAIGVSITLLKFYNEGQESELIKLPGATTPEHLRGILSDCDCEERIKANPAPNELCKGSFTTWHNSTHYIDNNECKFLDVVEGSSTYGLPIENKEQIGFGSDAEDCREWCNLGELSKLGCDQPILDHLFQYSTLLDKEFDGSYLINAIGLPEGISEKKFQECIEIIYEKRFPAFDYELKTETDTRYGSQYQITGGKVDKISYDADSNSLIIFLNKSDKGYLQIMLPSGLFFPINKEGSAKYFVIEDGEEVGFEQLSPILIKIPFEKDTKKIEVIGITELGGKENEN